MLVVVFRNSPEQMYISLSHIHRSLLKGSPFCSLTLMMFTQECPSGFNDFKHKKRCIRPPSKESLWIVRRGKLERSDKTQQNPASWWLRLWRGVGEVKHTPPSESTNRVTQNLTKCNRPEICTPQPLKLAIRTTLTAPSNCTYKVPLGKVLTPFPDKEGTHRHIIGPFNKVWYPVFASRSHTHTNSHTRVPLLKKNKYESEINSSTTPWNVLKVL